MILAGKEYGSGSSRDWAAKGPLLLGVRLVIAESYERIHRSNLVGMGILPLQFLPGESAESLGLTGDEVFEITGIRPLIEKFASGSRVKVARMARWVKEFEALVRIDTPQEALYYATAEFCSTYSGSCSVARRASSLCLCKFVVKYDRGRVGCLFR